MKMREELIFIKDQKEKQELLSNNCSIFSNVFDIQLLTFWCLSRIFVLFVAIFYNTLFVCTSIWNNTSKNVFINEMKAITNNYIV